jgi:hypothetical protein
LLSVVVVAGAVDDGDEVERLRGLFVDGDEASFGGTVRRSGESSMGGTSSSSLVVVVGISLNLFRRARKSAIPKPSKLQLIFRKH